METLNEMMNAAIWKCNRFFKYYIGHIRDRFKNRTRYGLISLLFTPISIIPMCYVLMKQDYLEIYSQHETTKSKLHSIFISVRSDHEISNRTS